MLASKRKNVPPPRRLEPCRLSKFLRWTGASPAAPVLAASPLSNMTAGAYRMVRTATEAGGVWRNRHSQPNYNRYVGQRADGRRLVCKHPWAANGPEP